MMSGVKKQVDVPRLAALLAAAKVELLSAQCAVDRVRLQFSAQDIALHGDRQLLKQAVQSGSAMYQFLSQVEAEINQRDNAGNGDR